MSNLRFFMSKHNKNVLYASLKFEQRTRNCVSKTNCLLIALYTKQKLHQQIQGNNVYCGICETTFKKRYANHRKSFNRLTMININVTQNSPIEIFEN